MLFEFNRNSSKSLHTQICIQIRQAVLSGNLKGGDKLPPTRQMKDEYGVSRNVWSEAYEQLVAEGFLEAKQGCGTFVTKNLQPIPFYNNKNKPIADKTISQKWKADFSVGTPNPLDFPLTKWASALKKSV
ncbi:MAG: winged helix-turn-helix domain-containing protein [Spirochaetales bacterium]|nr:winged helix-turn-helix domain-containing protein [Spirochaetales bacterium]